MLMSSVGLISEKDCAGDARQKLKTADPTSRQRGRPTSTNPQFSQNNQREGGKIGRGSQMDAWHQDRLADWLSVVI
jgi:hypothetical protein